MTTQLTPTEIEQKIKDSPFSPDDFYAVTRRGLGKGLSINPSAINPRKALENSKLFQSVYDFLHQGSDKALALWEKLLIAEAPKVLIELARSKIEFSLHLYGKYQAQKIRPIVTQEFNEFGVVSPAFIYDNLDLAASWRHLLINESIGLRNILAVVNWDEEFKGVEEHLDLLQAYIDAAGLVMEKHHGVALAAVHRGADWRERVKEIIWTDTDGVHEVYRDLLNRVREQNRSARRDMNEAELSQLAEKNTKKN